MGKNGYFQGFIQDCFIREGGHVDMKGCEGLCPSKIMIERENSFWGTILKTLGGGNWSGMGWRGIQGFPLLNETLISIEKFYISG